MDPCSSNLVGQGSTVIVKNLTSGLSSSWRSLKIPSWTQIPVTAKRDSHFQGDRIKTWLEAFQPSHLNSSPSLRASSFTTVGFSDLTVTLATFFLAGPWAGPPGSLQPLFLFPCEPLERSLVFNGFLSSKTSRWPQRTQGKQHRKGRSSVTSQAGDGKPSSVTSLQTPSPLLGHHSIYSTTSLQAPPASSPVYTLHSQ